MFGTYSLGIRKKITLGFYVVLFLMIGTAFLTYDLVNEEQKKVEFVEVIDDFLNTTLEVRRFEKNYFLCGEEEDYKENMAFWSKLEHLLFNNIKLISTSVIRASFNDLWANLHQCNNNMNRLRELNRRPSDNLLAESRSESEEQIRSLGKGLTDVAERTSRSERQNIQTLIKTTGTILLLSVVLILFIGGGMATFVGRGIVRSLKVLEEQTRRISKGELVTTPLKVTDPEINSLLKASNRMTNELRVRQQQLVQTEKLASLGTLLSGVAHELNNPLSNISTSAQILAEEIDDADLEFKHSLIRQVVDQSNRARDIVRTLLEFSRAGKVNKQQLQQVCLNLAKNAVDVLGSEGHIWISAREVKREKRPREVEILIEDDGPGIPADRAPRIFDPFFTTKDVGHGSGLGLFIVHDIIEWHGGTINVDSRPGEGTTFIIWLPADLGEKK
jgi:signal transduction histidine kinase